MDTIEGLRETLDSVYAERNLLVALAAKLSIEAGHIAGLAKDKREDIGKEWENVVFIDLDLGEMSRAQLSWHIHENEIRNFNRLPCYTRDWDGHSTEKKYERIELYVI